MTPASFDGATTFIFMMTVAGVNRGVISTFEEFSAGKSAHMGVVVSHFKGPNCGASAKESRLP